MTFIEMCNLGRRNLNQLDDFIDEWHEGLWQGSLREAMGLTTSEYSSWVVGCATIEEIVEGNK
jgi:hypothetical protein